MKQFTRPLKPLFDMAVPTPRILGTLVLVGCCLIIMVCPGIADDAAKLPPASKAAVDYQRDVQPIFAKHCYDCHGPETRESKLRLDRKVSLLKGGESGEPAFVPGSSGDSHLIRLVSGIDPDLVMPPEGDRLTAHEIGLLRAWIDQGVPWPAGRMPARQPPFRRPDGALPDSPELERGFWSLQPVKPVLPPAVDETWVAGGVDAFVLQRLRDAGLNHSPPADRVTLIRRLFLDMHGLPPDPAEVAEFVDNRRVDAYLRLVDKVLASPHYGERWAQHWLDVVRFAETDGFETNIERPDAYHYRDYAIETLNADAPYDRFVFEQIAGDSVNADRATGFLVAGAVDRVKSPDLVLTLMQRQDELADMVNTTGTALLGLTLGCARCHHHKFDPVLQKDYYALQAVFAGVKHGSRPLSDVVEERRQHKLAKLQNAIAELESAALELGVRPAVNIQRNEEQFAPVSARFVRFTIAETDSGNEPCLDELEIYNSPDGERERQNVALASAGARASASGTLPGFEIHKLEHVNDGQYSNPRSWISDEPGKGWVTIELAQPTRIDRIVWSRDRKNKFHDRLPIVYDVAVSSDSANWQTVASSRDRLPFRWNERQGSGIGSSQLSTEALAKAEQIFRKLKDLKEQHKRLFAAGRTVYAGVFEQPKPTHRLYRGDPMSPREVVAPGALTVLGDLRLPVDTPEQQRRVALAKWIASPDNPLTARVLVNRLWHYHFGTGIVDTPSDFGANGGRPSHPDLLDWLAGELVKSGWSLKHVQRLILLSSTYRQSSTPVKQAITVDSDTRLLWRFPPRRLEAEAIRDCMLSVSGVLDERMGGPGFSTFVPNNNYVRVYLPKQTFTKEEWRRMIYMTKVRMELDPVFGAFDCPDAGQVSPKRSRSTTPLQALNLLNSGFVAQQSEKLAARLEREAGSNAGDRTRRAFLLAFGREPDAVEAAAAVRLIEQHGLPALCRAMFNSSEFLFMP